MKEKNTDDIDVVITWVNGFDPVWKAEKALYEGTVDTKNEDNRGERYRPMDTFVYLFRGIEKFAPWVHKVYLVTYGHLPEWLNIENEKLVVVRHSDFMPKEYLPTFNATPIELNLHRIKGLAEQFVYFNDDMFIIKPTKAKDFFVKGLPCDSAVLNAVCTSRIKGELKLYLKPIINMSVINTYFSKTKTIKEKPFNWYNLKYGGELLRTIALSPWKHFTGFENWHLPYSICKSTIEELWTLEAEFLDQMCKHKFRQGTDVNIWLFLYWQYAKNKFHPRNPRIGTHFSLTSDTDGNMYKINKMIKRKTKLLCLNDEYNSDDDSILGNKLLNSYFDMIFPDKSSYEM